MVDYKFNFGIIVVSYKNDLHYALNLYKSFLKYCKDNTNLIFIVPQSDLLIFQPLETTNVLIKTQDFVVKNNLFKEEHLGFSSGYLNQQITKLCFWESGIFRNYLCLDSDFVFIRNFDKDIFIDENGKPYLHACEDRDLLSIPSYFGKYGKHKEKYLKVIERNLHFKNKNNFRVHGLITISSEIMSDFKNEYMEPNQISYKSLIKKAPIEFSWYLYWILKKKYPLIRRDPIIKTFHMRINHLNFLLSGIKISDMAKQYVGIVINSGFSRKYGVYEYEVNPLKYLIYSPSFLKTKLSRIFTKSLKKFF